MRIVIQSPKVLKIAENSKCHNITQGCQIVSHTEKCFFFFFFDYTDLAHALKNDFDLHIQDLPHLVVGSKPGKARDRRGNFARIKASPANR